MNSKRVLMLLCAVMLIPSMVWAFVPLTMGNTGSSNSSIPNNVPITAIDLINPASATGNITTVTVGWSTASCSNGFKVKFFRRNGDTLTLVTERGPFNITSGTTTVAMSPAVPVQQGDLIGVTRLASCGNPVAFHGFPTAGYVSYTSDTTGSVSLAAGNKVGDVLIVSATGTATEYVAGVIPAAASLAGGFGSNFKTAVQLLNPNLFGGAPITGRLVFHPAGASPSPSDPVIPYSLASGQILYLADIVAAMGRSGLGTIDLIAAPDAQIPVVVTRVFNDGGASGTSGFTEEMLSLSEDFGGKVMFQGGTGFLVTPPDPATARFNIGVRALFSGATITFTLKDGSTTVRSVTKTYGPNVLEQLDAATLLGGPIGGNQSIVVSVSGGSAIVYGATNDNVTNDPSIQFATVIFAIA